MRQLALWSSALLLFVVSFGVIYLSFRSSAPALRGAVGGGFFMCVALLLLWRDLMSVSIPKEELGLGSVGVTRYALERIQVVKHHRSPMLAPELPPNTDADASAEAGQPVARHKARSGRRSDGDTPSNRAA
jgi:hypothetical protein